VLDQESGVLPYSYLVGQDELRLALELSFIAPGIGGVLISGERGTAKSTAVRAFALMVHGRLPVTLPINATDDRVLGGWRIDQLLVGQATKQPGLLEEASDRGLLYVDEVNLLDDHIVNIILDVSSTGLLSVQREGLDRTLNLSFSLVGTMNPEEGGLRPQLLDRFGLMVNVEVERDPVKRREILLTVLQFDQARSQPASDYLERGRSADRKIRQRLERARERFYDVEVEDAVPRCAEIAARFDISGHRGDIVMALAARALAARDGDDAVGPDHLRRVAPMALQHRRHETAAQGPGGWQPEDDERLAEVLSSVLP
jgi:magnesium chelatase subunit I